jgi:hypothetical protein
MVAGGFGRYHHLWRGGTKTKRTDAIHTPWATPPALGLGSIHWGGRVVSTTPTNAIMSLFFLCMHVVDYFVEYIHIFYTLLINNVPKFPPRLPLVGGYQPVSRNWEGDLK